MLTEKERQIAALIAGGKTDAEIASALGGISPRTVSNHVARILDKLRLSNRVQIAVHWTQNANAS